MSGKDTSEFKKTKGATWTLIIGSILAIVLAVGPSLLGYVDGTTAGVIAAAVIGVAAIVQKCLIDLGYIQSRTQIKLSKDINKNAVSDTDNS